MKKTPLLAFVGAGRWQLSAIECARSQGIRSLALDGDPKAPGLALADMHIVVDIRDPQAVLDAVLKLGVDIDGAIAIANESGMAAAAGLREHFGLIGPDSRTTQALCHKGKQRMIWGRAGLPNPRWLHIEHRDDASLALGIVGLPAIAKPVDSAGSRGVRVIRRMRDQRLAADHAIRSSRSKEAVIEEFVEGVEYTVETFTHRGRSIVLAITSKRKVAGTDDTVADELRSADRPSEVLAEMGALACRALDALGLRDGPGHTEILERCDGRLVLVESAGRGGGFGVFESLIPTISGFDIVAATVRQAVGWELELPEQPDRNSAVLRFVPSKPGRIAGIRGIDRASAITGVWAVPLVERGDETGDAKADGDRLALILTTGDDNAQALRRADRAEACIEVELEEESDESHRHASAS